MLFFACGNFPDNYKKSIRHVCNGCKRLLSHNTLSHNTLIACLCLDCCARLYHALNSDLHVQVNGIHNQLTVHSPSRRFCNWLNRDLWISHALWNHTGVLWRHGNNTKRQTADQQKGRQLHVTTINYVEVNCYSFFQTILHNIHRKIAQIWLQEQVNATVCAVSNSSKELFFVCGCVVVNSSKTAQSWKLLPVYSTCQFLEKVTIANKLSIYALCAILNYNSLWRLECSAQIQ